MNPTAEEKEQFEYVGDELDLFERAVNWKTYLASQLRPYLNGNLLEVGAGFGTNIPYFYRDDLTSWLSLEPDPLLCERYERRQVEKRIPERCQLIAGTLESLPPEQQFDSIIYIDVLEHIEKDQEEFHRAYQRLRPGGYLSILCPAHNYLFSPFDKAIGHFRRYNKEMFRGLSDERPIKLKYLDSAGLMASVGNSILLKQTYPTEKQIKLWDGVLVKISQVTDPLVAGCIGKSVLGIWQKPKT